ncbi:hypothetical protein HacjB3_19638 (plasmid) [Halalkalicoccus jeotgali B3]|uniref:Uncharacterized protein n=1 Tax=Halalkalicoccus jeotgali (strain DSM 18796 / CECT 7217 / JCM 14584 / KCTC 4019 / B3) TaxID=795797 RepID=D8JDB0_HALJB|nr:hypothetical protein [Halalkalicoccus jeotgali]ADJ17262.1 hypothetical protein HacjB3_19638 [Halalkalicoccus jeotgali B3]
MSRDDREDLRRRIEELRDRAGERPDLIEALGIERAAEWWFDPDTQKRMIQSSLGGSQRPQAVVTTSEGEEYRADLIALWTGVVSSQDPDEIIEETEASG